MMQTTIWAVLRKTIFADPKIYVLLLLFLLAFALSTYNLEYYPKTWFDEGWWLQIPRNLVQYGQYATLSSEGFRYYDTVVGTSPAFYLPIAVAFKIWGVGLLQARLVMVAFFLATCLLVYAVTRQLYGSRSALIALALFILVKPDDNFTSALLLGRQAMGEIPALCFLMAAAYFWIKSFDRWTNGSLVVSGIFLGLAMTTKAQFMLIVFPTLAVLAAIDRLYYKQRRYRHFLLPLTTSLGVVLLQYLFLLFVLGMENFSKYLSEFSAASGPQVRVLFSPAAVLAGLKFFLRSDYFIWVAPGLAYTFLLCAQRQPENIKPCFVWVFVGGWLIWFLVASIGWARYTFPALAASYILVAKLLDDLAGTVQLPLKRGVWRALAGEELVPIARAAGVLLIVIMLLLNSSKDVVQGIFATPDRSAQQFAAYLDTHVGKSEIIETWEWEIPFLTQGLDFHHPPTALLNSLIAHQYLGSPYDAKAYNFQQYGPTYIVVGPFAKWTILYPPDFLGQECTLAQSFGEYDLYRINTRRE
jgi:4-amino-4-deoxy-L-arabinose transferase-like glycosyltransferase